MPALEEGGYSAVTVFALVFSSLVALCFCILVVILRRNIRECLHYAPVQQQQLQSQPLVPGEFQCFK
jgi:hypothetical protein